MSNCWWLGSREVGGAKEGACRVCIRDQHLQVEVGRGGLCQRRKPECDAVVTAFWPIPRVLWTIQGPEEMLSWGTVFILLPSQSLEVGCPAGRLHPHGVIEHVSLTQWHFTGRSCLSGGTWQCWTLLVAMTAGVLLTPSEGRPGCC